MELKDFIPTIISIIAILISTIIAAVSVIAVFISFASLFWNVRIEKQGRKAKLEVWHRNHYTLSTGLKIELLFRNLSHRPTGVLDVFVRRNEGGLFRRIWVQE